MVRLTDVSTRKEIFTVKPYDARTSSLAFSPDGRSLAVTSVWSLTGKVFDTVHGKERFTLHGKVPDICCVTYSPDGTSLATVSYGADRTVRLWDANTGREIRRFSDHSGRVCCVSFSPDGKRLASGGDSGVKIWSLEPIQERFTFGGNTSFWHLTLSPNGRWLATSTKEHVTIYDARTGAKVQAFKAAVYYLVFSSDGKRLASAGVDETVRVWDIGAGKEVFSFKRKSARVALATDGKHLALAEKDNTVTVWEVDTSKVCSICKGHTDRVNCLAFSPDGKWLASGSTDRTAKLWDWHSGKHLLTLPASHAVSVRLLPDPMELLEKAVAIVFFDRQADALRDIARALAQAGCKSESMKVLTLALQAAEKRGNPYHKARARCDIAKALAQAGEKSESINVLSQSWLAAVEIGYPPDKARALCEIAAAQAQAGEKKVSVSSPRPGRRPQRARRARATPPLRPTPSARLPQPWPKRERKASR